MGHRASLELISQGGFNTNHESREIKTFEREYKLEKKSRSTAPLFYVTGRVDGGWWLMIGGLYISSAYTQGGRKIEIL